jgi:hypothetical protein
MGFTLQKNRNPLRPLKGELNTEEIMEKIFKAKRNKDIRYK